jgi:hypothetical protein
LNDQFSIIKWEMGGEYSLLFFAHRAHLAHKAHKAHSSLSLPTVFTTKRITWILPMKS